MVEQYFVLHAQVVDFHVLVFLQAFVFLDACISGWVYRHEYFLTNTGEYRAFFNYITGGPIARRGIGFAPPPPVLNTDRLLNFITCKY